MQASLEFIKENSDFPEAICHRNFFYNEETVNVEFQSSRRICYSETTCCQPILGGGVRERIWYAFNHLTGECMEGASSGDPLFSVLNRDQINLLKVNSIE